MRVESGFPNKDGGWLHRYDDTTPRTIPVRSYQRPIRRINTAVVTKTLKEADVATLATELGVSPASLNALDCAWSDRERAFVFPMRDGQGEIVGFRTRTLDGQKKAITGSRQGIFIPNADVDIQDVVFLPEGPTDTAAFLTMGFYAIGRPSCNAGGSLIREALKRLGIRKIVVVKDNDEPKENGKRPGYEGAEKLMKELGTRLWWVPPRRIKDTRKMLNQVGVSTATAIIRSDMRNKGILL